MYFLLQVCENVYVNVNDGKARIGGFYSARFQDESNQGVQMKSALPAPEIKLSQRTTSLTDVWDFGFLLWNVFSEKSNQKSTVTVEKVSLLSVELRRCT